MFPTIFDTSDDLRCIIRLYADVRHALSLSYPSFCRQEPYATSFRRLNLTPYRAIWPVSDQLTSIKPWNQESRSYLQMFFGVQAPVPKPEPTAYVTETIVSSREITKAFWQYPQRDQDSQQIEQKLDIATASTRQRLSQQHRQPPPKPSTMTRHH